RGPSPQVRGGGPFCVSPGSAHGDRVLHTAARACPGRDRGDRERRTVVRDQWPDSASCRPQDAVRSRGVPAAHGRAREAGRDPAAEGRERMSAALVLYDASGREITRHRRVQIGASGYTGARTDRPQTKNWRPGLGSPTSDTVPDLPTLRSRSRDLERNAPIARGALDTNVINVVGTGLKVLPHIDREFLGLSEEEADAWERQAQRLFNAWEEECDITRQQTFAGLTPLALLSMLLSGDVLAIRRFKRRPGELVGTKVQLVEADRVSNPRWPPNTDRLIEGVELDADGAPVAYHVLDHHPGDAFGFGKLGAQHWKRVQAFASDGSRLATLLFQRRRPGQPRGVPYLAPVIEALKQLDRYAESELQAAVISSFFTVFVTSPGAGAGAGFGPFIEGDEPGRGA